MGDIPTIVNEAKTDYETLIESPFSKYSLLKFRNPRHVPNLKHCSYRKI